MASTPPLSNLLRYFRTKALPTPKKLADSLAGTFGGLPELPWRGCDSQATIVEVFNRMGTSGISLSSRWRASSLIFF